MRVSKIHRAFVGASVSNSSRSTKVLRVMKLSVPDVFLTLECPEAPLRAHQPWRVQCSVVQIWLDGVILSLLWFSLPWHSRVDPSFSKVGWGAWATYTREFFKRLAGFVALLRRDLVSIVMAVGQSFWRAWRKYSPHLCVGFLFLLCTARRTASVSRRVSIQQSTTVEIKESMSWLYQTVQHYITCLYQHAVIKVSMSTCLYPHPYIKLLNQHV